MQNDEKTFARSSRRFGVEIEYNSLDGMSRSVSDLGMPMGVYEFADKISKCLNHGVDVRDYHNTVNNDNWIVKPDSSCGLEVCSPPMCGYFGINSISKVVTALSTDKNIKADERCSMHVHVEIADFTEENIVNLFKYWVSNELFFFFMTDCNRWLSSFCQPIGFSCPFDENKKIETISDVFSIIENYKYYAINFNSLHEFKYYKKKNNSSRTVEFRIMGNNACVDAHAASSWCKLLVCFVDKIKTMPSIDKIEYNFPSKTLELFDFKNYFGNKKVNNWINYKIKKLIDDKTFIENNLKNDKMFVWNELVKNLRDDFVVLLNKTKRE